MPYTTSFFAPEGLRTEYSFDKSTLSSGKEFYTPKPGLKSTFSITVKKWKDVEDYNLNTSTGIEHYQSE